MIKEKYPTSRTVMYWTIFTARQSEMNDDKKFLNRRRMKIFDVFYK